MSLFVLGFVGFIVSALKDQVQIKDLALPPPPPPPVATNEEVPGSCLLSGDESQEGHTGLVGVIRWCTDGMVITPNLIPQYLIPH